jgi:hypothetical protein
MLVGAMRGHRIRLLTLVRMVFHDYAVGWGTLTLINAGLAQGKGRSGLIWWMLSLLLGPIATLLIVVLPNHSTRSLR